MFVDGTQEHTFAASDGLIATHGHGQLHACDPEVFFPSQVVMNGDISPWYVEDTYDLCLPLRQPVIQRTLHVIPIRANITLMETRKQSKVTGFTVRLSIGTYTQYITKSPTLDPWLVRAT